MRAGPPVRSPRCPTCPSVPAFTLAFASKAHLPTSALFRARVARPGVRASYTRTIREEFPVLRPRFPAAFRPPGICFFGHPVLPGNSAPITVGLPHRLRIPAPGMRTHSRVSTFRTHETQTGPGALSTPGTAVFTGHRGVRSRRLPPLCGRSLPPRRNNPARSVEVTKHQQEFPGSRPIGHSPRLWPPWLERRLLGFSVSSAPDRSGTGHARHGGDRLNTNPSLRLRHQPDLLD
jgi:hypothetical protein